MSTEEEKIDEVITQVFKRGIIFGILYGFVMITSHILAPEGIKKYVIPFWIITGFCLVFGLIIRDIIVKIRHKK